MRRDESAFEKVIDNTFMPSLVDGENAWYSLRPMSDYALPEGDLPDAYMVQIGYDLPSNDGGPTKIQYGRWFVIPSEADDATIVKAMFDAYSAFWLHEMCEHFKYEGARVLNPHRYLINLNEAA